MELLYNRLAVVSRICEPSKVVDGSKQILVPHFSSLTELRRDCSKAMVRFDADVDCCFSWLVQGFYLGLSQN